MKTLTTNHYPTHHVAHDNPGVWVDHEEPEKRGGFTVSCYREPWPSPFPKNPDLWCGIDIDLDWHASGGVVVDCNVTFPNMERTALRFTQWVKGPDAIDEARRIAQEWLANHRRADGQLAMFGEVAS